jgi:N-formylglutamate amidohydrolase
MSISPSRIFSHRQPFLLHWVVLICALALAIGREVGAHEAEISVPDEWLTVERGDFPVIIVASHGGTLRPEELPDRSQGNTVRDTNTTELAIQLARELEQKFGKRPSLVVLNVHRIKLDANREIAEAALGNPLAMALWQNFHDAIRAESARVQQVHGAGLLLDLHGHGRRTGRVELGYVVSPDNLLLPDAALDADLSIAAASSISALSRRSLQSFSQILRGPESFGSLLEAEDYLAVPSASRPHSGNLPYFQGGFIVREHGSATDGEVCAIQIEVPLRNFRDTGENRQKFARALTLAIEKFFQIHASMILL